MKKQLILILLLIPSVFAHLQIAGFMYDPVGADSGYEWVELYNPTNQSLSLQNYSLWAGNGANQNDWTRKYNGSPSVVKPGHYFLLGEFFIDNVDESISFGLQNGPDAIRIDYLNKSIEVIGWGEHSFSEYYQNDSLADIPSKAYVRINTTGSNHADFIASENPPRNSYFNESVFSSSGDAVTVVYDVVNYRPNCDFVQFKAEDMSHESGLQVYPFTEFILSGIINISDNNGIHDIQTIIINEEQYPFAINASDLSYAYEHNVTIGQQFAARMYSHSIVVQDSLGLTSNTCFYDYEILPIIGIESETVTYMKQKNNSHHNASVKLTNTGNIDLFINITIEDISQFGLSIAFESLRIENYSLPTRVFLSTQSSKTFELTGKPSFGLKSGSYAAKLSFIAHDAS